MRNNMFESCALKLSEHSLEQFTSKMQENEGVVREEILFVIA